MTISCGWCKQNCSREIYFEDVSRDCYYCGRFIVYEVLCHECNDPMFNVFYCSECE